MEKKVETVLRDRTRERSRVLGEYQMEKWLLYGHNGVLEFVVRDVRS